MLPILFALLLQTYTPLSAIPNCAAFAPVSGSGYDSAWTEYAVTDAGIAAIMALDTSRSFWVGYDNGGFDAAFMDADPALTLTLTTADGREQWFDVYAGDGVYYALPFAVTEAYADVNGDHYGTHPCAAFVMTEQMYRALLRSLAGQ